MTPLQITMLLHYHTFAEPYINTNINLNWRGVRQQHEWLIIHNLLCNDDSTGGCGYRVTEKGRVYIEALQAVPLPVSKWVTECEET
jgi:predicted transcriptional regulator